MRPVEALGLVRTGKADQHDHDVGGPGHTLGLGDQFSVVLRLTDAVASCERDLAVDRAQLLEQRVDPGRVHLGGAGALEPRCASELADHREAGAGGQRQQAVVLQQHDRLGSGFPGEGVVGVGVEGLVELEHRHALGDQLQHRTDPGVEDLGRHLARLDRGHDLLGAAAQRRRHLQVGAGQQGRDAVVDRAPVGDHETLEAELFAEHRGAAATGSPRRSGRSPCCRST